MRWIIVLACVLSAGCAGLDSASLDTVLRAGRSGPLDESTVAAGLKEALRVGIQRAIENVSVKDGYFGNSLIRIPIPDRFETAAGVIENLGFDKLVDDFEISMNRAAEMAAGEAADIFWNAIAKMTIQDAMTILHGHETAATEYFRARTEPALRERFMPIVQGKMSEVGLYQIYDEFSGYYDNLPFLTRPALDLDEYVTDRALDGLFTVLGQQEQWIREDPAARTTDLLKRVFGAG